ncbi:MULTISPECIES: hypothetical protein [Sphingobacterium]|uniref:N-acetyltransferase domain-containing protein n=1 Tax=Sphingobacterium zeae TaxID=1776859 RepID=A0ABU0U0X5_9SPHI|nr:MULTISPECIES: hypothetical protein [Sphingobacterium]MDQ1148611.1 hypothetical protein [Sphingobacterium zeae]MDR6736903.1 hypothetical protein [Sphingobacterium sp. 2149]
MPTTAHQPYLIRQVDLSDLALIKEILNKKHLDTDSISMPFLVLEQGNQLKAFSSVILCKKNLLSVEMTYEGPISDTLFKVFTDKAQSFFEQQLMDLFGSEESLRKGIYRYNNWLNQSRNSKLA